MRRNLAVAGLVCLLVAASHLTPSAGDPVARGGRMFDVHPGQLNGALRAATDGDTLILHHGRYRGIYTIRERLRLIGAPGEPRPVIDGRCRTRVTLEIEANGVRLSRLQVVGATEGLGPVPAEIEATNIQHGRFTNLVLRDTCDAEYGINVFETGPLTIAGNRAVGFDDAGIYLGGITRTGRGVLRVVDNDSNRNNRGIVVEDSAGGRIAVTGNRFNGNVLQGEGEAAGVSVQRADGVLLEDNTATGNGVFGIRLDSGADRNRLFGNVARNNPGGNFHDEGVGNCGSGNHPNPFPPC
jgi:parallel beta-helix repeat protein